MEATGEGIAVKGVHNVRTKKEENLRRAVFTEAAWIVRVALEGVVGQKGKKDSEPRIWPIKKWITFLGNDCKKEYVPNAMDVLVKIDIMEKTVTDDGEEIYSAKAERQELIDVIPVLSGIWRRYNTPNMEKFQKRIDDINVGK